VPFYFAFGEEFQAVKNTPLAVMLLAGLLGAVLCASASLAREIGLELLWRCCSQAGGRTQFLLAKLRRFGRRAGVAHLCQYDCRLLASRMAFDAYGSRTCSPPHLRRRCHRGLSAREASLTFFLRRPFVSERGAEPHADGYDCVHRHQLLHQKTSSPRRSPRASMRLGPGGGAHFVRLWILAGLALACSTRLDIIPTLQCSPFFLLGLMSDYLFGRKATRCGEQNLKQNYQPALVRLTQTLLKADCFPKYEKAAGTMGSPNRPGQSGRDSKRVAAEDKARRARAGMGGSWFASVLYAVTPNWQLFWFGDTLESEKTEFNGELCRQGLVTSSAMSALRWRSLQFCLGRGNCLRLSRLKSGQKSIKIRIKITSMERSRKETRID